MLYEGSFSGAWWWNEFTPIQRSLPCGPALSITGAEAAHSHATISAGLTSDSKEQSLKHTVHPLRLDADARFDPVYRATRHLSLSLSLSLPTFFPATPHDFAEVSFSDPIAPDGAR